MMVWRVAHVQTVQAWADEVPGKSGSTRPRRRFRSSCVRRWARPTRCWPTEIPKLNKLLSVHDPDARRGKHGEYYEGYLLDVAMDADSELITGVNVLPANGNEGADATHLIRQEEQAHGNDVEAISMEGAGFRGDLLRELTDPHGLNLEVFEPPSPQPVDGQFQAEQFTLAAVRRP